MKKIFAINISLISIFSLAQIKQGNTEVEKANQIKQESVNVERVYEPNVDAAQKIKQTPQTSTPESEKYDVSYQSVDIAPSSDFETSPIQAEKLPVKSADHYPNYVRVGYGNNANLSASAFVNHAISEDQSIGINASYRASNPSIENTVTDTNWAHINAEGFYNKDLDNALLSIKVGGEIQKLNLYGINPAIGLTSSQVGDVVQRYTGFHIGTDFTKFEEDAYLKKAQLKMYYFTDKFDGSEVSLKSKAKLFSGNLWEFSGLGGMAMGIKSDVNFGVTSSQFTQVDATQNKFNFVNLGATPQISLKNDVFKIDAGINLQYVNESEAGDSDFHLFPNIKVGVYAVPEFGLYGGVTGGVELNNFKQMATDNPYLYADQALKTSVTKIEFYAGILGDIGENFKYNVQAGYQDLEDALFFKKADFQYLTTSPAYSLYSNAYSYANTFSAVYDNGSRSYLNGKINYLGVDKLDLGAYLNFQSYDLDQEEEAWEKPSLSGGITSQYSLVQGKLILGGNLFFTGERDAFTYDNLGSTGSKTRLDAYLDLNLNADFLINERWSIFVKANNIFNKEYYRFADYQMQGFNAMGGFQFKF